MGKRETPTKSVSRVPRHILTILSVFVTMGFLSSCEEAAPMLLTGPGLIVAAPVGGALVLADGPKIRQPVVVRSASGETLTPGSKGSASANFKVDDATVICTGTHNLNQPSLVQDAKAEGGYSTAYRFPLTCNKGLKGLAYVSVNPAYEKYPTMGFNVGPSRGPLKKLPTGDYDVLREISYSCYNEFRWNDNPVSPFRVKCLESPGGRFGDIYGAVAQTSANQDADKFTVWIFPSN